ncbi:DNA dependent DNA polymerase alpha inactive calcineurin like phosphatase subunit [Cryptosporidium ubiquitum]|uniref:DNA polymerase alpha subunit B n=1 Tax=Cryptosporidium ubiquitum TaxID=857276 RepID=A0A1J4MEB5_9CRYT|nr:DNA dependent DNA polymerase alpha inactive calcineurin like phosphatase subunit [Cryptosporidium ubiquitum]OII72576.1 DNA dependent DNA polymerase alpha inactive calcineurin like phosphatase subunit [Cryptosporidium ubiquitum]
MSSKENGVQIIERIQTLLGEEYDNYKESFEVIHKSDPLSNPQKFISHVEKYLGHSILTVNDKIGSGHQKLELNKSTDKFSMRILNRKSVSEINEYSPTGKGRFENSERLTNIKSFSSSMKDFDYGEMGSESSPNSKLAFKINVQSLFNDHIKRRKGCLTDKSFTKYYAERIVENSEDSLWLDSDLESYSKEVDRRIQSLIDEIISNCSDLWIDDQGNKYPIIPVGETRKQVVVTLGAIGCDNEGNLNEQSVLLLGTRASSSGNVSQLKLRDVNGDVALYPGQVVAILGNTEIDEFGQSCILAKEIIGGLPPKPVEVTLKDLKNIPEFYAGKGEHPVQCMIFSGPFTTDGQSLNYDYLTEILKYANTEKPHVLILLGPFIDVRNESIKKGDLFDFESNTFVTFEDLFQRNIYRAIESFARKNEKVKIYIIPSEYDAAHPFPIPQPGLKESFFPNTSNETFTFCRNIYFLSNPCELYINDIKIAITSSDIVTPIFNSCITTRSGNLPLEVVLSQFLYQRTLYPCFPVQHPINPKLLQKLALSGELPHIIITPFESSSPFVKSVLGRIFVNPTGDKPFSGISLYINPPTESQIQQASQICQSSDDQTCKVPLFIEERICADEISFLKN